MLRPVIGQWLMPIMRVAGASAIATTWQGNKAAALTLARCAAALGRPAFSWEPSKAYWDHAIKLPAG